MFTVLSSKPSVTRCPPTRRRYAVASTRSLRAAFARASPSCLPMTTWCKWMVCSTRTRGQRAQLADLSLPWIRVVLLLLLFLHQTIDLGKITLSFSLSVSAGLNRRSCTWKTLITLSPQLDSVLNHSPPHRSMRIKCRRFKMELIMFGTIRWDFDQPLQAKTWNMTCWGMRPAALKYILCSTVIIMPKKSKALNGRKLWISEVDTGSKGHTCCILAYCDTSLSDCATLDWGNCTCRVFLLLFFLILL